MLPSKNKGKTATGQKKLFPWRLDDVCCRSWFIPYWWLAGRVTAAVKSRTVGQPVDMQDRIRTLLLFKDSGYGLLSSWGLTFPPVFLKVGRRRECSGKFLVEFVQVRWDSGGFLYVCWGISCFDIIPRNETWPRVSSQRSYMPWF